ncbi:hypothetical protein GN156_10530 [bacterium LRH843]|nr:hypothetical protein [bacterium LRH843]
MESQVEQKDRPTWLKWIVRIVLGYVALLAIILAITIIVILVTFTLIVIDGFSNSTSLGSFSEQYLVPISEFMWSLFTWLIPGL